MGRVRATKMSRACPHAFFLLCPSSFLRARTPTHLPHIAATVPFCPAPCLLSPHMPATVTFACASLLVKDEKNSAVKMPLPACACLKTPSTSFYFTCFSSLPGGRVRLTRSFKLPNAVGAVEAAKGLPSRRSLRSLWRDHAQERKERRRIRCEKLAPLPFQTTAPSFHAHTHAPTRLY